MCWFSVVRLVRWLFKLAKLAMHYSTKVATQTRLGAIIGEEDMFASQTYILKICSQQRCQKLARDVQRIRTWAWVPYGAIDVVIQIYRKVRGSLHSHHNWRWLQAVAFAERSTQPEVSPPEKKQTQTWCAWSIDVVGCWDHWDHVCSFLKLFEYFRLQTVMILYSCEVCAVFLEAMEW